MNTPQEGPPLGEVPNRARWRKRLLLLLASLLLGLVAAEGFLRTYLGNAAIAPLKFDPGDGRCVGLLPGAQSTYTGMGRRLAPVVQGANELGFRGEAVPMTSSAVDGRRIAALGDSFTYGQGVLAHEALPAVLQSLADGDGRGRVEVLNFGVPG